MFVALKIIGFVVLFFYIVPRVDLGAWSLPVGIFLCFCILRLVNIVAGLTYQQPDTYITPQQRGIAFEKQCVAVYQMLGWHCDLTNVNDQGADIIASRDGIVMVVQCKDHQALIGNSAVQQIVAARLHYNADLCSVVSNSAYSRSAIALAQSNQVNLTTLNELNKSVTLAKPAMAMGRQRQQV